MISMRVFVVCSFHVGSGAQSSTAYANALALAKDVFIAAVSNSSNDRAAQSPVKHVANS